MKIHIMYENIDTIINMTPTHTASKKYYQSIQGQKTSSARSLTFDSKLATQKILSNKKLSEDLKTADPEIDHEIAGKLIEKTTRIVVNDELEPVYTYKAFDVLVRPTGEKIERPHLVANANINETIPVKITDKLVLPTEAFSKFIFRKSYYLSHGDGVTYKFLHDLAKKLAEAKQFARLQAFDQTTKKPAPLVLIAGGPPFAAAFLEGRIEGDKYCLMVHLSDREFKVPQSSPAAQTETKE